MHDMGEDIKVIRLDCTDSTNNYAKQLAKNGEKGNVLVIAKRQTAGRGRLGRSFYSDTGGAYFSLLIHTGLKAEDGYILTALAAVCAAQTVEQISEKKCLIKWVNDVYTDNKKLCGILTEGACDNSGGFEYAVVGVGINVYEGNGLPEDIKDTATSVFGKKEINAAVIENLIGIFTKKYLAAVNGSHEPFINEYRRRSMLNGKTVSYQKNGLTHTATVICTDEKCRLVLNENGKEIRVSAGEVSVKPE